MLFTKRSTLWFYYSSKQRRYFVVWKWASKQPVKAISQFVFQGWYFESLTIRVSKAWSANILSFTLSRYHYNFKDISEEGDDWLVGWCGLNGPLRQYFSRFSETTITVSANSPECSLKWPFIIVTFILEMGNLTLVQNKLLIMLFLFVKFDYICFSSFWPIISHLLPTYVWILEPCTT